MSKKTNPKKIPRSQKDVDDAYRLGTYKGTEVTLVLLLRSFCDLGHESEVWDLWEKFEAGLDSMHRGDTKLYDERDSLEEEYGVKFEALLQHFGYKSKF